MIGSQIHGTASRPPAVAQQTVQRRLFEILEAARPGDRTSRLVDRAILTLIALNVLAEVLESVQAIRAVAGPTLHRFDLLSVAVFTVEYVARLWCCTVDPRYAAPVRGRLKFMASAMGLVDLAAILPFYLPVAGFDMRVARSVRLVRLLRVAKLARYSSAFAQIGRIVRHRKEELVASLSCVAFLLLVASSLMYAAEGHVQPEAFSSIPAAMWWGISTMTTVGYGDVYPITPLGKLLGAVVSLMGMGLFALPAGILGSAFIEDIQRRRGRLTCPRCGASLHEVRPGSRAA